MTLTLLQGLTTIVCLQAMKARGWADFPSFNWDVAKKVAPLSFVFISYVVISLFALERVNVPMFTALRRLTVSAAGAWPLGAAPAAPNPRSRRGADPPFLLPRRARAPPTSPSPPVRLCACLCVCRSCSS
jgi:hypothetical protein